MAAALLGLAALLYTSSVAFQTLKYIGVVYLLFMAWSTFRERGALELEEKADSRTSAAQVIRSAILVNVLNPKLSIFFLAFLPQFVRAGDSQRLLHMLELSSVFMLTTLVVFIGYGLAAARVRRAIISRPRILAWLRRTFAAAFVALGAKLALAER
jgi:threonine/homoserine/homoserine lactone efflux protein